MATEREQAVPVSKAGGPGSTLMGAAGARARRGGDSARGGGRGCWGADAARSRLGRCG